MKTKSVGSLLLALLLLLALSVPTFAEAANASYTTTASRAASQSQVQVKEAKAKGYLWADYFFVNLKKGKTKTVKMNSEPATSKKITWSSTNPKVAKVNQKGKITAVKQGTAYIKAEIKNYDPGYVFVIVKGASKDPKILSAADAHFTYNNVKVKQTYSYSKTKKLLPKSYAIKDKESKGLGFGSSNVNKTHTNIWFWTDSEFGAVMNSFYATKGSPIKTNRGVKVGTTMSGVKKKYGEPTEIFDFKVSGGTFNGKKARAYIYDNYVTIGGLPYCLEISFVFNRSNNKFMYMRHDYYQDLS